MEPSKEAIAVRITRLNRLILGKVTGGTKFNKKTICREALLDALTVLYDECNDDPIKRADELVKNFVDKYRSTLAELRMTRVCISDFETIQTIGRGHFGDVNMVREKQTGDVYAVKTMRKEQTNKRAAEDERDVLANANSPWIPRLQYAFQDNNNLYLAMELCPGGDLAALLARRGRALPEREAAFYVGELAHALKALHALGYVHRDLKPHNVLLDRCGHVKVCDFGSAARLSERAGVAAGTADYMAPELLAAADCATHNVCQEYCGRLVTAAISACDYWSLGVIAFELVTLRRPFSSGDEDSIPQILSNIQKYERSSSPELPWEGQEGEEERCTASCSWRALVAGLVRVAPARRYSYLDVLQHAALAHLPAHHIRDQAPPWVPAVRGAEDASCFRPAPRGAPPPCAAPFRARPPFAGQLPFVGYSYVAPEENEDHSGGFNASHDCTAIDLATFKSAEKLAAMRSREIQVLQTKLAEAEASSGAAVQRARHEADLEAERQRARLQADITALSLQNKRLERQVEVEREERMALQRTNQELSATLAERNSSEVRNAQAAAAALKQERDALQETVRRLENQLDLLHAESKRAVADADAARAMHQHYKDIIGHVQELRHRRLTEINVRPIDSVAKERAIRRQTLSGGEAESREAAARVASAEANAAREARARQLADTRAAQLADECRELRAEADDAKRELAAALEQLGEKRRVALTTSEQLKEIQTQLAQERVRSTTLLAQVQELERSVEEAVRRETCAEEQSARTEARLAERLRIAEAHAAAAHTHDRRHREKVNTLEQLVRQLEREVSALEKRTCGTCASLARSAQPESDRHNATLQNDTNTRDLSPVKDSKKDIQSDTESVADTAHTQAQLSLLKEQLERGEAQLQARTEEIAALRQEARAANLARWRKEREYNELSVEMKSTTRDLKRTEERLTSAIEARRAAEKKAGELVSELATLKPLHEQVTKEAQRLKEQLDKLMKTHEVVQVEVDRSRNDIRKLKSELQYSEKRRLHAEEQEELSSRERVTLRDELHQLREHNNELVQNNKALQEACSILEEQLTDLEKVCDIHEVKNKDLENQLEKVRSELASIRARLTEAEWQVGEQTAVAARATQHQGEAREQARHAACEITLLRERLEARSSRVAELEARVAELESERAAGEATHAAAARRLRDLHEESAALRTRAHHHHAHALQLQAALADLQEELAGTREAAEAAAAWWRTRETKADATLRQQAKLIDFLQAKVEEAGRKKCSLSNKLFGRSGRRTPSSPPLRRVNKELREEVERLRSKLAAFNSTYPDTNYTVTPKREKTSYTSHGSKLSNGSPGEGQDKGLLVVWPDGSRERMRAKCVDEVLVLTSGERELRARMLSTDVKNLPHNEANRAFVVQLEGAGRGESVAVVCASVSERDTWVSRVCAAPPEYTPALLATVAAPPTVALHLAPSVVAIGTSEGLQSLRGPIQLEWQEESLSRRADGPGASGVTCACGAGARVLLLCGGALGDAPRAALASALRRAPALRPALRLRRVPLPDDDRPRLVRAVAGRVGEDGDGAVAAVACVRRVFVLQYSAAAARWAVSRALVPPHGSPHALLVTRRALFGAGERAWAARGPGGTPQPLAPREPTVAAAAARRSPPKALLQIREEPLELLVCYAECGVFLDERGERTRSEDPKWSSAVCGWEYVPPFLYVIGDDKVTVVRLDEDAYRAPPCTCDATSLASSASECYLPQTFTVKVTEPVLLGPQPAGILLSSKAEDGYRVSLLEGLSAFRSVGASVESLATLSESKGSSVDLTRSTTEVRVHDVSQESVEVTTDFLADIRNRARQLKDKNRTKKSADDVIKEILTTEVEMKRTLIGRKSPASISDSDGESESPADICADMFARQVRFQ